LSNCRHDASTGAFKVLNAEILAFLRDTDFC
jgi:hypothetical protein